MEGAALLASRGTTTPSDSPIALPDKTTTIPTADETATIWKGDETTTIPRADETFTIWKGDETTTIPRADETSTIWKGDETTTIPRADKTPTIWKGDDTTTIPTADETPTIWKGDKTTTIPRADETPTIWTGDETMTIPRADETTTIQTADDTASIPTAPGQMTEPVAPVQSAFRLDKGRSPTMKTSTSTQPAKHLSEHDPATRLGKKPRTSSSTDVIPPQEQWEYEHSDVQHPVLNIGQHNHPFSSQDHSPLEREANMANSADVSSTDIQSARGDKEEALHSVEDDLADERPPNRIPLQFDLDDEEQLLAAGKHFNYSLLPALRPDEILSVALYQIKTRCNVSLDTHVEYLEVFRALLDFTVLDTRTVETLLERVTGIRHERYDVCRNGCVCFAKPAYTDMQNCPFCGENRRDRKCYGGNRMQPCHL
jgi:hypothetical protein